MRTWCSSLAAPVLLFALLHSFSVYASGPTNEQEALADLYAGRFPIAISSDGSWLFHVDDSNVLYRETTDTRKRRETIALPMPVLVVSPSRNGERVAVVGADRCTGIITFASNAGPTRVEWIKNPSNAGEKEAACGNDSGAKRAITDNERFYGAVAVALSEDGKRVAISGNPIRVIDIATRRTELEIPTGGAAVLHVRFIDSDKKLFVTQAVMGEQWESAATGSDMQFAVWDLKSRELFSFHHTGTNGNLISYDLLSHFSEATGELWAINTDGRYWEEQPHRRAVIRPHALNLKQCRADLRKGPLLAPGEGDGWLAFTADPLGRWLAYVTPAFNAKLKRYESHLWVRNSRSGKTIADWPVDAEIHSMVSTADGKILYAVTAGQPKPDEMSHPRAGQRRKGGGKLVRFDLGQRLTQLEPAIARDWPPTRCMLEDEAPGARDIVSDKRTPSKLYEVTIEPKPFERDLASMPFPCYGDEQDEIGRFPLSSGVAAWGQTTDGSVWVDRGATMDRLDPATGKIVQSTPTPRSATICALPLFEQSKYVAWQGDTVTFRPLAGGLASEERKVFVRKPGWYANKVERIGPDRIGVRWVDKRFRSQDSGEKEVGAMAVLYDSNGKVVRQIVGAVSNGGANFPDDEFAENAFGESPTRPERRGMYRWELSYFGSVRAVLDDAALNSSQTVLWSGLHLNGKRDSKAKSDLFETDDSINVIGLQGAIGVHVKTDMIDIYDAASRMRASIGIHAARNAAWNPVNRILLVDSVDLQHHKGKLTAYRIPGN